MDAKFIARINGVEIPAVVENGETFIPVKPICEAIGVADQKQREKIQNHPILSSVGTLRVSTGADGKKYEMFCLPLKYVYGWLFTINPGNVSPEAKENVIKYQNECYEALYDHFTRSSRRQIESNEAEIRQLKIINEALAREREAKTARREAEAELTKIRASRLDNQPTLF